MGELDDLQQLLRDFAEARDWEQFHTPKNLVMALGGEVGELTEIFQWLTAEESQKVASAGSSKADHLREELADVFGYLLRLADVLQVDLAGALRAKVSINNAKYPADESRGSAAKYTDLQAHSDGRA